jgi:hypothetical protein
MPRESLIGVRARASRRLLTGLQGRRGVGQRDGEGPAVEELLPVHRRLSTHGQPLRISRRPASRLLQVHHIGLLHGVVPRAAVATGRRGLQAEQVALEQVLPAPPTASVQSVCVLMKPRGCFEGTNSFELISMARPAQ